MKERTQTPRSAKPLSLTNMATSVFSILEQRESTSFSEVADLIVDSIGQNADFDSSNEQRTLRRRVYDVLNVFFAAGFVVKENKTIKFVQSAKRRNTEVLVQARERLQLKKKVLADKLRLLIFHKLVIARNAQRARPLDAVQLPCIFVGFTDIGNGEITKTLNGLQLQIVAESPPLFFSPMNVFETLGFSIEEQSRCLKDLDVDSGRAVLETLLFSKSPDMAYQEKDQMEIEEPKKRNVECAIGM